jgi:hypothetical protein
MILKNAPTKAYSEPADTSSPSSSIASSKNLVVFFFSHPEKTAKANEPNMSIYFELSVHLVAS